jgi:predicted nuclease of restriction endonuclease-like RecB superfamily
VLTADLVEVRRRGEELHLIALDKERLALATRLGGSLLAILRGGVGQSREELQLLLGGVEAPARARRLVLGLRKILDDDADWAGAAELDPVLVRRTVFELASVARRELGEELHFDRERVLAAAAASLQVDVSAVERALFADLRAAEVLRGLALSSAEEVVARYAKQQVQAVLLRAVKVRVLLRCDSPGAGRALFHKVKFLRLLHTVREAEDGCYELEIDGPYSLFESVTKYGLQLALLVPLLEEARWFRLDAEVRWGRGEAAKTLRFRHEGGGGTPSARPLSDEAQALLDGLAREKTPWRGKLADTIVSLPGVGLCVPDLALTHSKTGEVVYVELLGYYSREAVWRRKELVERGLTERIVFVLSSQLRVREDVIDEDAAGALYVYKRVPSARVLLERVDSLAARRIRT